MAGPLKANFECPECGAKYKTVQIPKVAEVPAVSCGCCRTPLPPEEGKVLLQYRLVGRPKKPKQP